MTTSTPHYEKVTITSGASKSNEVNLRNKTLCGLFFPATMTGANVTILTTNPTDTTGATEAEIKNNVGTEYSIAVATGDYVYVDPAIFVGVGRVKVESDASEAADRDIYLAVKDL